MPFAYCVAGVRIEEIALWDTVRDFYERNKAMDGYYLGHTCLTLEIAYLNARVVSRLLIPWLTELVK